MPSMLKYIALWFPMLLIAIANGTAREWYKTYTGEISGRQISTLTLLIFFGVYIYWAMRWFPAKSATEGLFVGLLWVVMTLLFEFGFGLYRGNTWGILLEEYNLFAGRLWILVPIWVALAPYLFYKLQ